MASEPVGKLRKITEEAKAFLEESNVHLQDVSQQSRGKNFAHFWLLAVKSFIRNRCLVRASALAYTSLLALIPLLAVVISVSTSLLKSQGEEPIKELLEKLVANVAPQLDLVSKTNVVSQLPSEFSESAAGGREEVVKKITEYIGRVHSGTLGISGVVSLILVAILLLSNIESTFNDIWGVSKGRSWFARVVQYWAAITLGPITFLVVVSLTSGPHINATKKFLSAMPFIGELFIFLLPFGLLTLLFSLFYALMPNTRVHWKAALVGGIVGGFLWQMNNLFNIIYVSKVVTYSKIYGSFSMVPLLLIGMYFSWVIVLFGSQVSYTYQNRISYLQQKRAESISQRGREFCAFRIMAMVGLHFQKASPPPTQYDFAEKLGIPSRLIGQLTQTLVQAHLIAEVTGQEPGFIPCRPLNQINLQHIIQAVRSGHGFDMPTRDDSTRNLVRSEFERISLAENRAASEVTLENLVSRFSENTPRTSNS